MTDVNVIEDMVGAIVDTMLLSVSDWRSFSFVLEFRGRELVIT